MFVVPARVQRKNTSPWSEAVHSDSFILQESASLATCIIIYVCIKKSFLCLKDSRTSLEMDITDLTHAEAPSNLARRLTEFTGV